MIELQQPTPAEVEAARQAIEKKVAEIRQKDADTRKRLMDSLRNLYGEQTA